MDPRPPRQQDPLSLAVFGAALALLAGLLAYVFFFRAPEPATSARALDVVEALRKQAASVLDRIAELPAEQPAARPPPKPRSPPPAAVQSARIEAGHTWRYSVVVDPPIWRDITLTYRTRREGEDIGVLTDFVHAGGKSNFHLGIFSPGHPTHANTRFPGFFMYGAYLKPPFKVGDEIKFGWHWQGKSAGSMKRFAGTVTSLEDVTVPAGTFRAVLIEGMWSYMEDGQFRARTHEKIWYVPSVSQVVKIHRSGIAPDEGSRQIDAELMEYR